MMVSVTTYKPIQKYSILNKEYSQGILINLVMMDKIMIKLEDKCYRNKLEKKL